MSKLSTCVVVGLSLVIANSASATLQTNAPRGVEVVQIPVPGKTNEICVIPKHFSGADFSDKDAKKEKGLCALDIHTSTAVCPKLNSTNPGLDFYSVPEGSTADKLEAAACKSPDTDKLAKYKLSTSCSYSPAILGYYHMSRILGDIANVPPSVIRTVDLPTHIHVGQKALATTAAGSVIHQTWAGLMSILTAGSKSPRRDLILTGDFAQSYGALSENPKHENFYKEFFNGGADNVSRAVNFRDRNPTMLLQAKSQDISTLVGRDFNAANVQKMVQLKDASELVILDTLFSQQDRYGNIHEIDTFMYLDKDGKIQSERKLEAADVTKLGAVQVKEMILKDNDCGVAKDNVAAKAGLMARINHVNPDTYSRLIKLNAVADQADTMAYFEQELLFTAQDYAKFRANLKTVAGALHDGCSKGKVKLDLDLSAHFSKASLQAQNCEAK